MSDTRMKIRCCNCQSMQVVDEGYENCKDCDYPIQKSIDFAIKRVRKSKTSLINTGNTVRKDAKKLADVTLKKITTIEKTYLRKKALIPEHCHQEIKALEKATTNEVALVVKTYFDDLTILSQDYQQKIDSVLKDLNDTTVAVKDGDLIINVDEFQTLKNPDELIKNVTNVMFDKEPSISLPIDDYKWFDTLLCLLLAIAAVYFYEQNNIVATLFLLIACFLSFPFVKRFAANSNWLSFTNYLAIRMAFVIAFAISVLPQFKF